MELKLSEEDYRCPISGLIFCDPVATCDGHIYERETILKWLETHNTSPKTGLSLENKTLTPVLLVKNTVSLIIDKRKELQEEVYVPRNEFLEALRRNDGERLRNALEANIRLITFQFEEIENRSMLHLVCIRGTSTKILIGALKAMETKLKQNPFEALLLTIDARTGWTPVHSAINCNNKVIVDHCVSFLIEQGLEAVPKYWQPARLKEPVTNLTELLLEATKVGDVNKCALFLHLGASLEATDKSGSTPLILAAFHGHIPLVQFLIDQDANLEASNASNNTPLIVAAGKGHFEIVQILVNKRANLESTSIWGNTALIVAAFNGFKKIVEYLLSVGSNPEARNKAGNTAIMDAAMMGHKETVEFLMDKGVNTTAKNNEGKGLLDVAKDEKLRQFIREKLEVLKTKLLKKVPKVQAKLKSQQKVIKKQQKQISVQQKQIEALLDQLKILSQALQVKMDQKDFQNVSILEDEEEDNASSGTLTPASNCSQTEVIEMD